MFDISNRGSFGGGRRGDGAEMSLRRDLLPLLPRRDVVEAALGGFVCVLAAARRLSVVPTY